MPDRYRWTADHLVAAVELVCGLGIAAAFVVLGVRAELTGDPARTVVDRAFPFVLAAVGLGLVLKAVRTWRAAARPATPPALPAEPAGPVPPAPPMPPPSLTPGEEQEVARIVAVLGVAGVFAPRIPDPADLTEAVADIGPPVTAQVVLSAIEEAAYHRPHVRPADHLANLVLHPSHTEQDVLAQADDLRRSARGRLDDVTVAVAPGHPLITVDGAERAFEQIGAPKYLSTVLHAALATVLRERGSGYRFAWLWSDQGCWITLLPDGAVAALNAELHPAAGEAWSWIDEDPPVDAGRG